MKKRKSKKKKEKEYFGAPPALWIGIFIIALWLTINNS
tara:strand:- start:8 stop:121 length:114 start_codon:yes stop_codon:yes gene_type:complete